MGDFLLDLRPVHARCTDPEVVRLSPHLSLDVRAEESHFLCVARVNGSDIWLPHETPGARITIAGTVALDDEEWLKAERVPGQGGLAAKAIAGRYLADPEGFDPPEGAYVIHIHDRTRGVHRIVTDPGGLMPCYRASTRDGLVIASHPDTLAEVTRVDGDLDLVSLGEFLATGRVSHPFSYFRAITAMEPAAVHSIHVPSTQRSPDSVRKYFEIRTDLPAEDPNSLPERLAMAIQQATRRRTGPRLGRTAVALSGGLDSRTILCNAHPGTTPVAFCVYDAENLELSTARQIAAAAGVKFHELKRTPEHYGDSAELGVRLSGGMGDLASNHFLGFLDRFRELGIDNLVTGCYFDYLFKSLALDVTETRWTRRERLSSFRFQHYLPVYELPTMTGQRVRERLEQTYPPSMRTAKARMQLAARRTFPLNREGDNAQRLTMLRTTIWQPPAVDRTLLDVFPRVTPDRRLDAGIFRAAVRLACPDPVSRIHNTNTMTSIDASPMLVTIMRYRIALRRAIERRRKITGSAESWPNWEQYLMGSPKIRSLWERPHSRAADLLEEITGSAPPTKIDTQTFRKSKWFLRLLTLKLWLSQRR